MFTGIIQQVATIVYVRSKQAPDGSQNSSPEGLLTLGIAPAQMWSDLELGESIACNGVCLTVTGWNEQSFEVDLSRETLDKTAPYWQVQHKLNLERAMTPQDRFGGHMVSGHVDGVAEILDIRPEEAAYFMRLRAPEWMAKYLVPKGSITVDGVSLTIVESGAPPQSSQDNQQGALAPHEFTLCLVPHTLEVTTLKHWKVGQSVHVEADQVAKYLERLAAFGFNQ